MCTYVYQMCTCLTETCVRLRTHAPYTFVQIRVFGGSNPRDQTSGTIVLKCVLKCKFVYYCLEHMCTMCTECVLNLFRSEISKVMQFMSLYKWKAV